MSFVVIASHRLHFIPGTLTEAKGGYLSEVTSVPVATREQAELVRMDWRCAVRSEGWEFRIEERPAMRPVRIQRRRTKGWRLPPNTLCVTRPGKWGNPFRAGMFDGYTAADAVRDYRGWIEHGGKDSSGDTPFGVAPTVEEIRRELGGKNLACFCRVGAVCHGDILLAIASSPEDEHAK